MRYSSIILLIFCHLTFVQSQDTVSNTPNYRPNSLYIEIGGNGGMYSLNYDRLLSFDAEKSIGYGFRIGFSYFKFGLFGDSDLYSCIPLEGYILYGKKKRIETGLGYTFNLGEESWFHIGFRTGFRFQGKRGAIFRIAPVLGYNLDYGEFGPIAGLSFGASFSD